MVVIIINNGFHTTKGYEIMNSEKNAITSSMEDYIEMIYRCSLKEEYIRLSTVAHMLNVRDSSASKMMKKLGELSLITYKKYGLITLSEKGKKIGEYLYKRHNIIEEFLRNISEKDYDVLVETELIEHVIGEKTVKNIRILNDFFSKNADVLNMYIKFKDTAWDEQ